MEKYYTDTIESVRLNTRFLTLDDVDAWTPYFENEECCRFLPSFKGFTDPKDRAKEWIDFAMLRYQNMRAGMRALIHKETGELIGQSGLLLQEVEGKDELEVGYHLLYPHWHQGYATEAASMFKDYVFGNNMGDYVISIINPQNDNSKRVAMRNGMKFERQAIFRDSLNDIFKIYREEWMAAK